MPKPLIVDLSYPDLSNLTTDIRAGKIISFAYATLDGELNATLQYIYHSNFLERFNMEHGETLVAIAIAEMHHLDMLAKAMIKFGVDPIYRQRPSTPNIYYNTSEVSTNKTPRKMIMDDISGEMTAIANYNKMLFILQNQDAIELIKRIILDEQLHLETLKKMLEEYKEEVM